MSQKIDENTEIHNKRISYWGGRRHYDGANILRLVKKQGTPCRDTVTDLKWLLALAEQGRLTTFSYAGLGQEGLVTGTTGLEDKHRTTLEGALLGLAIEIKINSTRG